MALENFFVCPEKLAQFRKPPLGSIMDNYCEWLHSQGFSHTVICTHISCVSHFNQYLKRIGIKKFRDVRESYADRFISTRIRKGKYGRHREVASATRSIFKYLKNKHVITNDMEVYPHESVLEEYTKYLSEECSLIPETVEIYHRYLVPLLKKMEDGGVFEERLRNLSIEEIERFFREQGKSKAQTTRGQIRATLCRFLHFCFARGYIPRDLSETVPKICNYRLSNVPTNISERDVEKLLASIDRTKPPGKRDYAIIQLLHTYGVRGIQIRRLRLQHILWHQKCIRFLPYKGGKEVMMPLTIKVGESILDYLRHDRPQSDCPEVFLTTHAPLQTLKADTLYAMVANRTCRAGITGRRFGPHAFRHGFATRMLRNGQSLKTIADFLGHRNINTTFIYTKVDLTMLKQASLDWPEVLQCEN